MEASRVANEMFTLLEIVRVTMIDFVDGFVAAQRRVVLTRFVLVMTMVTMVMVLRWYLLRSEAGHKRSVASIGEAWIDHVKDSDAERSKQESRKQHMNGSSSAYENERRESVDDDQCTFVYSVTHLALYTSRDA